MAIKVALAASLLVTLLVLSGATTYTTTIITTSDSEANPRPQCQQVVQQRRFQACQDYLRQPQESQYGQQKDECCRSLHEMERQGCECEAIQRAASQAQQMGQQMGRETQQVYQRAQRLPQICNLRTQQCDFRVIFL